MSGLKGVRCRGKESSKVDIQYIFSSTLGLIWVCRFFQSRGLCCDSGLLGDHTSFCCSFCAHGMSLGFSIQTIKLGLRFGIEIKQLIWEIMKCLFCIELFFSFIFLRLKYFKTYESQWMLYSCVVFAQYSIADFRH